MIYPVDKIPYNLVLKEYSDTRMMLYHRQGCLLGVLADVGRIRSHRCREQTYPSMSPLLHQFKRRYVISVCINVILDIQHLFNLGILTITDDSKINLSGQKSQVQTGGDGGSSTHPPQRSQGGYGI